MKDYIQIFSTTEKKENAERIAQTPVKKRLADCVQIIAACQAPTGGRAKSKKVRNGYV